MRIERNTLELGQEFSEPDLMFRSGLQRIRGILLG